MTKKIWPIAWVLIFIFCVIVGVYVFFAFTSPTFGEPSPEGFAHLGAYLGGIAGSLFGLLSAIVLFATYLSQAQQLKLAKQDAEYALAKNALPSITERVDSLFDKKLVVYAKKRQVACSSLDDIKQRNLAAELITVEASWNIENEIDTLNKLPLDNEKSNCDVKTSYEFCKAIALTLTAEKTPRPIGVLSDFRQVIKSLLQAYKVLQRLRTHNVPELYFESENDWLTLKVSVLKQVLVELNKVHLDPETMTLVNEFQTTFGKN